MLQPDKKRAMPKKPDDSVHHRIGDDKGEGGQSDIKTDTLDTGHGGRKD